MNVYELNENKLTVARQKAFIFNQMKKHTIIIYKDLCHLNIQYYLMHHCFFKILSQNREYVQTHFNDLNNPFHSACRKWYLYNNPQ